MRPHTTQRTGPIRAPRESVRSPPGACPETPHAPDPGNRSGGARWSRRVGPSDGGADRNPGGLLVAESVAVGSVVAGDVEDALALGHDDRDQRLSGHVG